MAQSRLCLPFISELSPYVMTPLTCDYWAKATSHLGAAIRVHLAPEPRGTFMSLTTFITKSAAVAD